MLEHIAPQGERLRTTLPEAARRLHRALLDELYLTGIVPPLDTLPWHADLAPDELQIRLHELVAADYVALTATGEINGVYPFSAVPTPHVVAIAGRRRYAMCAVDALGSAAMLDQPVAIESECGACRAKIQLDIRPGTLLRSEPQEIMVVARTAQDGPASERCCPFIVFACGPAHAQQLVAQTSDTLMLSLDDALTLGETLFGDLRSEKLPAARPRPHANLSGGALSRNQAAHPCADAACCDGANGPKSA